MADLQELQRLVSQIRQERGFTMDPLKIFILLNEEVGEVAAELKRTWSPNYEAFSRADLEDELADVLICLLALANQFEISLEEVILEKLVNKDGQREWKSVRSKADGSNVSLNRSGP